MSARDNILNRLNQNRRPTDEVGIWASKRRFQNKAKHFGSALTKAKGEIHHVANWSEARDTLINLLNQMEATMIALNDEPELEALDLPTALNDRELLIAGETDGLVLREFCKRADVGISGALAGIAETGTVVLQSGVGKSREVTLLPPVHIVLLETADLVTDIHVFTRDLERGLPSNTVFISGPSKSADIEQTLAVGVHGPKRFVVILVDAG